MAVHLTLGEAAREVTVTKSTLHRAIKDGRLSASRDDQGHYRIDPVELFRVFDPTARNTARDDAEHLAEQAEHPGTPAGTVDGETIRWFQQQIVELQEEKSELRAEMREQAERLDELRKAMAALPSPERYEAELERLRQENEERLERQKTNHEKILARQQTEQAKAIAEQRHQAEKWRAELERRKQEIEEARVEAASLKRQAADDIARIERRAAGERAVREALEKRGLIARLLNRKPKLVEG